MQIVLPQVLTPDEISRILALLGSAPPGEGWVDGKVTTGPQSALVKNNQQMPQEGRITAQARDIAVQALGRHPGFVAAALPRRILPPGFNRYSGSANAFGPHVDNALRNNPAGGGFLRTDISCTLFLTEPQSYDGGELVISASSGELAYKLRAGDMLLYPSTTIHHVKPVTRGERIACFFWVESMVASAEKRQLLHNLDTTISSLRQRESQTLGAESQEAVRLTAVYHNLLRMWAQA